MSEYLRIISYINEYIDGEKNRSCGFARIESSDGGGRIYININSGRNVPDGNVNVYMYKKTDTEYKKINIGEVPVVKGNISCTLQIDVDEVSGSGIGVRKMSGLYLYSNELNVLYVSEWEENTVNIAEFMTLQENEPQNNIEMSDTVGQAESTPELTIQEDDCDNHKESFFEELSKCCVKIPSFGKVSRCLCIKPCDFIHFPYQYQHLAGNSFLLGGYIRHKFLIVGCCEYEGMTKYILGVPGNNTQREKIMAEMFGFSTYFDDGGDSNDSTGCGNRGYWCTFIDD